MRNVSLLRRKMHGRRMVAAWFGAVCMLGGAARAHGQCQGQWVSGFLSPGATLGVANGSPIWDSVVWDADGSGPSQPQLIVAGDFNDLGGTGFDRIARWTGTTWDSTFSLQQVAQGVWSGGVFALAVWDHDNNSSTPERLIAGGSFSATPSNPIPANRVGIRTETSWGTLGFPQTGDVRALLVADIDGAPGAELYAAEDRSGNENYIWRLRPDGSGWTQIGPAITTIGFSRALAAFDVISTSPGTELIVGGTGSSDGTVYFDGTSWTRLSNQFAPFRDAFLVADVDGSGPLGPQLYTSGLGFVSAPVSCGVATTSDVQFWNGSAWEVLVSRSPSADAIAVSSGSSALALYDTDAGGPLPPRLVVYATPWQSTPNGCLVNGDADGLFAWDGSNWSRVGPTIGGDAQALTPFVDGDGSPSLFFGGSFFSAPRFEPHPGRAIGLFHLARLKNGQWAPFGIGLDNEVNAIAEFDPDGSGPGPSKIIAGGFFRSALVGTGPIAEWTSGGWRPIVNNIDDGTSVLALTTFDFDGGGSNPPRLVAAGRFDSDLNYEDPMLPPGPDIRNIARWDGSTWSSIGNGLSNEVRAVAVATINGADVLVAATSFAVGLPGGGTRFDVVGAWNGTAWGPIEPGLEGGTARAFATFDVDGNGTLDLVVGGDNLRRPGVGGPGVPVVYYDGDSWETAFTFGIDTGGSPNVHALAVFDPDGAAGAGQPQLIAGGSFSLTVQPGSLRNLAAFHRTSSGSIGWIPLGDGGQGRTNSVVRSLAVSTSPYTGVRRLVVGGDFANVGTSSNIIDVQRIAFWSGQIWSDVTQTWSGGAWSRLFNPDGSYGIANEVATNQQAPSTVSAVFVRTPLGGNQLGSEIFVGGRFVRVGLNPLSQQTTPGVPSAQFARYIEPLATTIVTVTPSATTVCRGSNVTFTAVANGTGPLTYRWFRGATPANPSEPFPCARGSACPSAFEPLVDGIDPITGVLISGANTPTLALQGVTQPDQGCYRSEVTSSCNTGSSVAVNLVVKRLSGDSDFSNSVGFNDITIILGNMGATGDCWIEGDATGNGVVDFSDVSAALGNFGATCTVP